MIREGRVFAGLSQRELAERAGTSQPAVNRYERNLALPTLPTLERLLDACGRRLVIDSAPGSRPLVTSVRGRSGAGAAQLRRARSLLLAAARRNGVENVRVFGSVARGDDDGSSDIDLLVSLAPGRTLLDVVGFRQEASTILGIDVDVATPEMLKDRVRKNALREAVPL